LLTTLRAETHTRVPGAYLGISSVPVAVLTPSARTFETPGHGMPGAPAGGGTGQFAMWL
jgi:hypothetical protein